MGLLQINQNDLVGAESTLVEGLNYLEPLKDEFRYTATTYNSLGLVLINLGRFSESRDYFKRAFDIHTKNKNIDSKQKGILDYYNNVGFSYLKEKNFTQAKEKFVEGLNYKTDKSNEFVRDALIGNLADCYYELGNKEKALTEYVKLLKRRSQRNDVYGLSLSHNGMAKYFKKETKYEDATYHAKKAYEFAKQSKNNSTRLSALSILVKLNPGNKAIEYFEEYETLNDSLINKERIVKDQFAKVRYETEKSKKRSRELFIESERQRQQKIISLLFSVATLLALGFSFSVFRARRKKLMYEAQLQKASAREEERQQIAKSLHDEVAGDLRMLHQKLSKTELQGEAKSV